MIPWSALVVLSSQHLTRPFQQIGNCGFGNYTAHDIVDELFHTYGWATVTDISKIDNTNKTLWDPNKPIEMRFKLIKDD